MRIRGASLANPSSRVRDWWRSKTFECPPVMAQVMHAFVSPILANDNGTTAAFVRGLCDPLFTMRIEDESMALRFLRHQHILLNGAGNCMSASMCTASDQQCLKQIRHCYCNHVPFKYIADYVGDCRSRGLDVHSGPQLKRPTAR